jgi:hypothetical protein
MDAPIRDLRAIEERATERLDDDEDIWNWAERHAGHNWIYRGQRCAGWRITSSLERHARRMQWPRPLADLEMGIYRRFQRHAHLFVESMPSEEDVIEWLALVRHFGAPTRLVDWSYSFHVALFFAARTADPTDDRDDAVEEDRCAAVWALDSNWLEQRAYDVLRAQDAEDVMAAYRDDLYCRRWATYGAVYNRRPPVPFVLKQNCWRLNERIVTQQGVFLCPGDVERGFEENLAALVRTEDCGVHVKKLIFPTAIAIRLMQRAYRSGISLATLQPGLEGFIRSLGDLAVAPEVLAPQDITAPLGRHQPGTPFRGPRPRRQSKRSR